MSSNNPFELAASSKEDPSDAVQTNQIYPVQTDPLNVNLNTNFNDKIVQKDSIITMSSEAEVVKDLGTRASSPGNWVQFDEDGQSHAIEVKPPTKIAIDSSEQFSNIELNDPEEVAPEPVVTVQPSTVASNTSPPTLPLTESKSKSTHFSEFKFYSKF